MNRNEYFYALLEMFETHIEESDAYREDQIKASIMLFIEMNPIKGLDEDEGTDPYLGDGNFADNH